MRIALRTDDSKRFATSGRRCREPLGEKQSVLLEKPAALAHTRSLVLQARRATPTPRLCDMLLIFVAIFTYGRHYGLTMEPARVMATWDEPSRS